MMAWRENFNPNGTNDYVPLPPSVCREYPLDFSAHDVAEINPRYLAIDLAAITEFKGTYLLFGLGVLPLAIYFTFAGFYEGFFDSLEVAVTIFLIIFSLGMIWFALGVPLHPPVYFNRVTRKVYGWQKPPGGKGRWFEYDFDQLTAVTRIYRLYNTAGRQTQYILQLLDVDPQTRRMRFGFAASSAGWSHTPEGMWEFIRRYMNEEPGTLPAAQVNMRSQVDGRRQALSVYEEGTIGSVDIATGEVVSPFLLGLSWIGSFGIYPMAWCTAFVKRLARYPATPESIARELHWEGGGNPYRTTGDGDDPEADARVQAMYDRIRWSHWIRTSIGPALVLGAASTLL